jgi:probable blue pigment (indigoidine) exporter
MNAATARITPHMTARRGSVTSKRTSSVDLLLTAMAPMAWGTTYVVTTELLPPDRPLLAATVRALPAGIVLALVHRRRPTGSWWWRASVLGVLNIGAFFALLFVAAYRLPGGVAATLGSIQPLVTAGLAAVVLGERFRPVTAVAGGLGIAGVGLLVLQGDAALDPIGIAAGLAGATAMATGVVLTRRWGRPVPLAAFTSWQLIAGGALLAPLGLVAEGPPPIPTVQNLIGFAWLATFGTGFAYLCWFRGISRLPVTQISFLGLLSPVVATVAGFVVLGQTLSPPQVAGAASVLAAIRVGQLPPRDPAATTLPTDVPSPVLAHTHTIQEDPS